MPVGWITARQDFGSGGWDVGWGMYLMEVWGCPSEAVLRVLRILRVVHKILQ